MPAVDVLVLELSIVELSVIACRLSAFFFSVSQIRRRQAPMTCANLKMPKIASRPDFFNATLRSDLALGVR